MIRRMTPSVRDNCVRFETTLATATAEDWSVLESLLEEISIEKPLKMETLSPHPQSVMVRAGRPGEGPTIQKVYLTRPVR